MSKPLLFATSLSVAVLSPVAAVANPLQPIFEIVKWAWHIIPKHAPPPVLTVPGNVAVQLTHTFTKQAFITAAKGATVQTVAASTVSATSFTITKAGASALLVISGTGAAAAKEYILPTREIFKGLDYKIDEKTNGKNVDDFVEKQVYSKKGYVIKYCLLSDGTKEIVPDDYQICPRDRSDPKFGEKIEYQ